MATTTAPVLVDRADIHKSCKSLEGIVAVLANYTEAANTLASIQKKLAKALKEAASVKGTDHVSANAMVSSAGILEGLAEVDIKFAKIADKEAENMSADLKKWFKKLAKEEKAHDERMASANARIKQAGQAYEKKSKRKDRDAAEEHGRYVAVLNSVGPEMSQDKYNHTLFVTQRHTATLSSLAASLSRLAEAEWMRSCEIVRRSAPSIGTVAEWRVLCEGGWSGSLPNYLPDLDDKDRRGSDGNIASMGAQSPAGGPDVSSTHYLNDYPESPTSSSNSKVPPSTHKSIASHPNAEKTGVQSGTERPPSPPPIREQVTNVLKKKSPHSDLEQKDAGSSPVSRPTIATESVNVTARPISTADIVSDIAGSSTTSRGSDRSNAAQTQIANPEARVPPEPEFQEQDYASATKHEVDSLRTPLSQSSSQPSRDVFATERMQLDTGRKINADSGTDRMSDRHTAPSLDYDKPPETPGPVNGGGGGGGLRRQTSIDSTVSRVAAMRERYTSGPSHPASPPPRDLPRPSQKVAELATRYTPIETPTSPSRNHASGSSLPVLSADRFPTFQERYPRFDRDKDRFGGSPEPIPERDYFDRDKERYRSAATSTLDRNQFLRDDRDNERYRSLYPHSPDNTQRLDELGVRVRERPQRIDIAEELALQEREAELHEQQRRLEADRARIANARNDSGYVSDTNRGHRRPAYAGARYLDAPTDQLTPSLHSRRPPQNSPPPDHSPSCGCQRCSAQHYASPSATPRTRRDSAATPDSAPIYKPEPPILLRPEKPKNWMRRMSMPVTSIVSGSSSDRKNATVQNVSGQNKTNMMPPDEDGRIGRRSFELNDKLETSIRFGGTTRRL